MDIARETRCRPPPIAVRKKTILVKYFMRSWFCSVDPIQVQLLFLVEATREPNAKNGGMETSKNEANSIYDAEDAGGLPDAFLPR
jgi:hypothetical protein